MSGKTWSTIFFSGSLDGKGHCISNLDMSAVEIDDEYFAGMLYAIDAEVKNIYFENCSAAITSDIKSNYSSYAAIIAPAAFSSTFTNCSLINCTVEQNGEVSQFGYAGGLVGIAVLPLSVDYCSVQGGTISANGIDDQFAGGLIGAIYDEDGKIASIRNSFCTANITSVSGIPEDPKWHVAGGIVGWNLMDCFSLIEAYENTYENLYVSGNITASTFAAGLVADCCANVKVSNCAVLSQRIDSPYTDPFFVGESLQVKSSDNLYLGSFTKYTLPTAYPPLANRHWLSNLTGTPIDATAAEAYRIEGLKSNLRGKLSDGNANVTITLSQDGVEKYSAVTDVDGEYNFGKQVLPDTYTLHIAGSDHYNAYTAIVKIGYAENGIQNIPSLVYKDADYSKVDVAIAKANALNKNEYKDFSAVDAAINAVVRGKSMSEQAAVDAMARAIEDALKGLEKIDPAIDVPQTGDASHLELWLMVLGISAACLTSVAFHGRKKPTEIG